ncbi:MAG: MinD/ParA family protein [Candidatus Bathyarchaeota archaeon]
MIRVIAIHSNRGGVGKTLVAVNLAMAYAKRGRKVCLIDLDFRAPSLYATFQPSPKFWMNDFFDDRVKIWDALVDVTSKYGVEGKLLIGFANPSLDAIRSMASKDRGWEMKALRKLTSLRDEIANRDIEYMIFDTSPGMLYSSINAVACSDVVLVVATADASETEGIRRAINELYGAFEKQTYVFLNKVTPIYQWKDEERKTISDRFAPIFDVPIMTIVPCYCDLLNSSRTTIYTLKIPEHPFSKAIYDTADKLSAIKD